MNLKNSSSNFLSKVETFIDRNILLILSLLSIVAVRYLFVGGFFGVSDDLHVAWLDQMDKTVRSFQFPPRYVPDLSFGFGYPLFTFVYPLPFYIAEVFRLIGFSLVDSIKIVFGLSIPLSMYFMYKLLKHYLSPSWSLAGAIVYAYAPYRALEIFVRGTIGEIVAFVIFPLLTYSYIQVVENQSKKWIGVAGLLTGLLVLSHNIMAYMFTPFLVLFVFLYIVLVAKNRFQALKNTVMSFILGLVVSAYFWVPAIYESRLVKYDTVFNFYDHYPTLKQLVTPFWGYGASVPGPYDTMSFYVGLVGVAVFVVGSLYFGLRFKKFSQSEKAILLWSVVVILTSVFMMNHRSSFLWSNIPLLPYFQFPWRFVAMLTFAMPIFMIPLSKLFKKNTYMPLLIIVAAIFLNYGYFKYSEYLGRKDEYYLNRFVPSPVASQEYRKTSEEYLRLPVTAEYRPQDNYPRAYTEDSSVNIKVQEINALDALVQTQSSESFVLNYSKYNYPGWRAAINGKSAEVYSGSPYGQISINVPAGDNMIHVYYRESPFRLIFDIVSLVGFFAVVYLICLKTKQS